MIFSLFLKLQQLISFFKDGIFGILILYLSITVFTTLGLIWSIFSYCSLLSFYYYFRIKILKESLDLQSFQFICNPIVQKYFVHKDIPAFIEKTIHEIALKYNYNKIPVEIIESEEDGAFCSYYSNNKYQIEITTWALYSIGAIPNKKLTNKTKKRLKAILAHEYAHFYFNDAFMMEFILLTQLFAVILLLINFQFTTVFVPFLITSLYSKFIEYRADLLAWKTYPEALILELKESSKEEDSNLSLIHKIRLSLFGSHPQYKNRIKFINYKKAKM